MSEPSGLVIRRATRTNVKPLVGFYGKSGSGKTMSALLFARGLVGPSGRITLIDSESGRGSIFADVIPGGYSVLDLDAPFSPARYEQAIVTAEAQSDVVVVDSMSHEWSGEGGVLDWAESELERMGGGDNNKMRSWIKPKMAHKMMIGRLLRCKVALICCLRGEEKTHTMPDERKPGKTKVVTDQFSSPLFDPRFIYEMLLNFETISKDGQGGYVIPRKITHPDIARLLPKEHEQIGIAHGEALAAWCSGKAQGGTSVPVQSADVGNAGVVEKSAAPETFGSLKGRLWKLMKGVHLCRPGDDAATIQAGRNRCEQHLIDEAIIADTETLGELNESRLREVIAKVEARMKP